MISPYLSYFDLNLKNVCIAPFQVPTCFSDGRVIVAGGDGDGAGGDLMDMEMFDPAADNGNGGWYGVGDLPDDDAYGANYLLWNGENIIWINGDEKIWLLDLTQSEWKLFEKRITSIHNSGRAIMVPMGEYSSKKSL